MRPGLSGACDSLSYACQILSHLSSRGVCYISTFPRKSARPVLFRCPADDGYRDKNM